MNNRPTAFPCVAPIQFFLLENGDLKLDRLSIEGGTVLLLEKENRYLLTAWHVWNGFLKLAEAQEGMQYGAFVWAGKLLALPKTVPVVFEDAHMDAIVLRPEWAASALNGFDFYGGPVALASAGDRVATWGYTGERRTKLADLVSCPREEVEGVAAAPCNGWFSFQTTPHGHLGGLSGAPVFREDMNLVGMVSEAHSELGIVRCCELQAIIERLE